MSYQVLARKWRPKRFTELVGQEHVVRALSYALDKRHMHHAYVFTGTRGVGKTTIARILAKSMNCERGLSASPCGECAICTAVDNGRFVDLLEIDAASHNGVDDVREVIENAQYAPSHGRFKVYLIDEVHMLSKPAFNALLKTLEEPSAHVKFLLATTDPQKLPMTVLSRCLKFNLRRLLPTQIATQMQLILDTETIAYEPEAMKLLARAADGSLRDGLSLLDQAISYGGGKIEVGDVRSMLGHVEYSRVHELLHSLVANDGVRLMAESDRIASHAPDFGAVLDDLAALLHRIQLVQLVPGYEPTHTDALPNVLSAQLAAEDVQLYYQIATQGRRDLVMAPDERTGFDMTLLRMLAFRPVSDEGSAWKAPATGKQMSSTVPPTKMASSSSTLPSSASNTVLIQDASTYWETIIEKADLHGQLNELARNSTLREWHNPTWILALQPSSLHLALEPMKEQLADRLTQVTGRPVRLRFISDDMAETPASRAGRARDAAQIVAEKAIQNDPLVQSIKRDFGAQVMPGSIKPIEH